jgi:hypothetical protein
MKAKWMSWLMGAGLVGVAGIGIARLLLPVSSVKFDRPASIPGKLGSRKESIGAPLATASAPSAPLLKYEVEPVVAPLQRPTPPATVDPVAFLASNNLPRLRPALLPSEETIPAGLAPTRLTAGDALDLLEKLGGWMGSGGQGFGIFVPKWTSDREILSPTAAAGGMGFGLSYHQNF